MGQMCLGNLSAKCNLSLEHPELRFPESQFRPDKEGFTSVTADPSLYFFP